MSDEFRYEPLNTDLREFRLIDLGPNKDPSSPVEITLRHASRRDRPEYCALSYTWGAPFGGLPPEWDSPAVTRLIKVNGKNFHVRLNLDAALRRLIKDGVKLPIWIDAICIDQSNIPEKNAQVQAMWGVYFQAMETFAWIGPDSSDSERLRAAIPRWTASWETWCRPLIARPSLPLKPSLPATRDEFELLLSISSDDVGYATATEDLLALSLLFRRNWFSRVWVVQEVAMSSSIVLLWAEEGSASWRDITAVYTLVVHCMETFLEFNYLSTYSDQRLKKAVMDVVEWSGYFMTFSRSSRIYQNNQLGDMDDIEHDFIDLLVTTRICNATDPRDHVYALLEMVPMDRVVVDYNLDEAEVFKSICRNFLERKNLSILGLVGPLSATRDNLPSWVIDFRLKPSRFLTPLGANSLCEGVRKKLYKAGGETTPRLEINGDSTMVLMGTLVGVLYFIGGQTISDDFVQISLQNPRPAANPQTDDRGGLIWPEKHAFYRIPRDLWMGEWIRGKPSWEAPEDMTYSWTGEPLWKAFNRTIHADIMQYTSDFGKMCLRRLGASFCTDLELLSLRKDALCYSLAERTWAVTTSGHFCLVPRGTLVGDVVMVAFGAETPYVLRPAENGQYRFAGYAYVHGFMDGEALEMKDSTGAKAPEVAFEII
ncbi:heterokaryon incompatibility protein-domain-containing protein [Rhypophila decipiens]|uniref:Heterokaryon incompatibility protein-domain-containing protein n=1 Tax=Rhypophila decipiens TaxID=261697 RepID=A0AAN6YCJ4_9PEZI|nr:heterokaryon incompatibility protein-domain-containing protein [Rhypophila decipiens]